MGFFDRSIDQGSIAAVALAMGATPVIPREDYFFAAPVGVRTTLTATDDRVYFVPVALTRRCDISSLGVEVTTGAASTTARVGLYTSDEFGRPASLIKEAAATLDTSTTGVKTTTLGALDLAPGVYHVAVKVDGAAVALRAVNGDSCAVATGDASGDVDGAAAAGETFYASSSVATALASTATLNAALEPIGPLVIFATDNVEA